MTLPSASLSGHLIPFLGRNPSLNINQNLLWKNGNVYIMDNHRAAMWCWLQEISSDQVVGLLHVDEHYDTKYSRMDEWKENLPPLRGLTIEEYLRLEFKVGFGTVVPIIQWDNYLSLFFELFPHQVCRSIFATQNEGDKPNVSHARFVEAWKVPENLDYWLDQDATSWIVNIDLDYFFCDQDGERKLMYSHEYINSFFSSLQRVREAGKVACLTICLTPDEGYTGGWAQAEELCARACEILEIPFSLPPSEVPSIS